ncbi:MAG: type I restriction enzyme HsdR N-terminal domain-containing protein [Chlamydiia bacterium]|nr:type I restriction enzyme HsdR N-terminal domain-containing protein [Chlamydiia bacterium]
MITCRIRKKPVALTPEEKVRQGCLNWMIDDLGYPPSQIVVEAKLSELPHLKGRGLKLPDRRVDILVYVKNRPALLVECKADSINDKPLRQLSGYRYFVEAPYVALVGAKEVKTFLVEDNQVIEYKGIPYYSSLLN